MGKKARVVPQRRPTKRQLSRWQREAQIRRLVLAGGAFAILLVVAIPIFGFAREYVFKGQEPVARVNQAILHLSDYTQILNLRSYQLDEQIKNLQGLGQSGGQLQVSLQYMESARAALPNQVMEDWISEQLVRQEASRLGISVSPEEVTTAMKPESDPDTLASGDPKPLSDEEFQRRYRDFLSRAHTTDALYRSLIELTLLSQKLEARLSEEIQSPAPQVHLQAILLTTEEEAKAAKDRLDKGEDFAQVAKEVSLDQSSKEQGGDLGWAPRGLLDKELEDAAFSAKVGELAGPVETNEGYYVFRVTEREESREIEPSTLEEIKAGVLDRWLVEAEQKSQVERLLTYEQITWAQKQYQRR